MLVVNLFLTLNSSLQSLQIVYLSLNLNSASAAKDWYQVFPSAQDAGNLIIIMKAMILLRERKRLIYKDQ